MEKKRLDVYLADEGLAKSRSSALAMIMAGEVFINGEKADKAGISVTGKEKIEIRGKSQKFVSRGGLKLEKAMQVFPVDLNGAVCMDIGASTGGFTDCMLQCGAKKVFSVDVGYGQLAWKLRCDERVVNMERTNIRYVTKDDIGEDLDFFSVDVSFISLKLVLPVAYSLLKECGAGVCLIKPQFEAGREKVGKKGVVRDKAVHKEVIDACIGYAEETGFSVAALDYSPVKGPEGNIEYLMMLKKDGSPKESFDTEALVERSHSLDIKGA